MKTKYIVLIFQEDENSNSEMKKFIDVLNEITDDGSKGASCGPINICFFSSEETKENIDDLFKKNKIKYILLKESDAGMSLPGYITMMFKPGFDDKASSIADVLNEKSTKTPLLDLLMKLNDQIHNKPLQNGRRSAVVKHSLAEQLEEAVKNDEFELAALLRDKIGKNPPIEKAKPVEKSIKRLFED